MFFSSTLLTVIYNFQCLQASVTDKLFILPNGLKKHLITNLVLESVLYKTLNDFLPAINNSEVKPKIVL